MEIFAQTDIGMQRQMNQDFVKYHQFDNETALLIVSDGMGGAKAGNVASEVASNSVYNTFLKKYLCIIPSSQTAADHGIMEKRKRESVAVGTGGIFEKTAERTYHSPLRKALARR